MSSHIDYHRFPRGEGCTEEGCRSRKFYIEDGKKFCQRGHEQAGFAQTQQDEDDWNAQGKKSRKKREEKDRETRIFRGREAVELYLQCYQLILWKQCFWLVNVKSFPSELETVVRDLWGLRMSELQRSRDEKSGYGSGTETIGFSSISEEDATNTDGTDRKSLASGRRRRRATKSENLPTLIETLALCYLGMLLMRLSTSLGEIYNWAARQEIIFLRAIKEVPKEMRVHLPSHFYSALETRTLLQGADIHQAVSRLIEFYNSHFEMIFPPLNAPLVMFKHIRDLGLPLEIYPAARRLATLLGVEFSYPVVQNDVHRVFPHPEIQLMSLIIVATKLSQPFDNIARHPESDSDPTVLKVDWTKWYEIMAEDPSEGLRKGEEINVTDVEVFNMSGKELDDYLDWYQRTWTDDRDSKMAKQILDLFPLGDLPHQEDEDSDHERRKDRVKAVQETLLLQKPLASQDNDEKKGISRPGELYKRYRNIEELPDDARRFYELAAKNVAISLHILVRCVFRTESHLQRWAMEDKKMKTAREQGALYLED